jgi:hypothetical protein
MIGGVDGGSECDANGDVDNGVYCSKGMINLVVAIFLVVVSVA